MKMIVVGRRVSQSDPWGRGDGRVRFALKDWRMGLGRARTERRARRGLAARFGATGRDTIAARAEDMTAEAILLGGEVGATGRDLL